MQGDKLINKKSDSLNYILSVSCIIICFLMLVFGKELKEGALRGINIALTVIVPTLFPFFILSDLWISTFTIKDNGLAGRGFELLFGVPGCAFSAFLSGLICGFPIGVKTATTLYNDQRISKDQLTRICGFCNNPSAAFIISGVGTGLLGSTKLGLTLYFVTAISAIICGMIFRTTNKINPKSSINSRQNFNLVKSVKDAGINSITVSSFIIFFSSLISALFAVTNNSFIDTLIAIFLEISCAVNIVIQTSSFSNETKLALLAFALSFSGLSVHLQAFCFMPRTASHGKYFFMKMVQGVIAFFIMTFYLTIK